MERILQIETMLEGKPIAGVLEEQKTGRVCEVLENGVWVTKPLVKEVLVPVTPTE